MDARNKSAHDDKGESCGTLLSLFPSTRSVDAISYEAAANDGAFGITAFSGKIIDTVVPRAGALLIAS